MQKAIRLLKDHSLPHTLSLICIPTLDSRKENICWCTLALLQTPGLARISSLPTQRCWGSHFRESVCACVSISMCMKNLNSHQNPVHLHLVTDFTAKIVMTLGLMFCTQPFMIILDLGSISFICTFFFSHLVPLHIIICQKAWKPPGIHCVEIVNGFRCSIAFYPSSGWESARTQHFQCKDSDRGIYGPKHFSSTSVCGFTSYIEIFTVCIETRTKYPQPYKLKTSNNVKLVMRVESQFIYSKQLYIFWDDH